MIFLTPLVHFIIVFDNQSFFFLLLLSCGCPSSPSLETYRLISPLRHHSPGYRFRIPIVFVWSHSSLKFSCISKV